MASQLGLVFSLALARATALGSHDPAASVVEIDVPLETAADSRNGGPDRRNVALEGAVVRDREFEVGFRLVRRNGSLWTPDEVVRVLRAGHDSPDSGPRIEIGFASPIDGRIIASMPDEVLDTGPEGRGRLRLRSTDPQDLVALLVVGGTVIATCDVRLGSTPIEFRYDPESFPGFARRIAFDAVTEDGCDVSETRHFVLESHRRDTTPTIVAARSMDDRYGERPGASRTWITAGRYRVAVERNAAKILECAGEVEIPPCAVAHLRLRVVTPVSVSLVASPEDRLRLFHTNSIRLVDERGFEHRLDATDSRHMNLDPADANFDFLVTRQPHEYFGAPRGNLTLVLESNAIPVRVENDPQVIP